MLYRFVNESRLSGEPIDYLEFGVYQGASIREWSNLNQQKDSRFFGFDCFLGLPETWNNRRTTFAKGTFDVGGNIPVIDDSRVSFVKGLFQESLPGFLRQFQPRNRLVVHLDADLYSSTLYVLSRLHDVMPAGTIVFFDEFITEEFRAWEDYVASHIREYSVLGSSGHLHDQVCVMIAK